MCRSDAVQRCGAKTWSEDVVRRGGAKRWCEDVDCSTSYNVVAQRCMMCFADVYCFRVDLKTLSIHLDLQLHLEKYVWNITIKWLDWMWGTVPSK
jgi:hypothetical protein